MPDAIDHRSLEWMPKSVWGPIKWKELHCRALLALPMQGEDRWFSAFVEGLPCPKCREHFEAFVHHHPPNFVSRALFFEWTVNAHNYVNVANGKRELSLDEALEAHREVFAEAVDFSADLR